MIRHSRPMSCAVASTAATGGRRSAHDAPACVSDAKREVRPSRGDELVSHGEDETVDVIGEPRIDSRLIDARKGIGRGWCHGRSP